jgi:hypothetical protein
MDDGNMIHNDRIRNLDLTICSVYHSPGAKQLLELNYDVVKKTNPDMTIHWIVADNTAEGFTDKIDQRKFIVIPGAIGMRPVARWIKGSYHYADAINNTLSHIKTRFVIFLDPDVYIIRKNWMKDVMLHMQEKNLGFFGIPYFPIHYVQIRYFPNHRALFVDLTKVPVSQLDFCPRFDYMMHPTLASKLMLQVGKIKKIVSRRLSIGTRPEAGTRTYRRFHRRVASECAVSVFVPATDLAYIPEAFSLWEKISPDFLSYIPKKTGYYTERGFRSFGLPDVRAQGWEEFMWKNGPFAFHIQAGTKKIKEHPHETIARLYDILKGFNLP